MSKVFYCDRCEQVFPEGRAGNSRLTLELMFKGERNPLEPAGIESIRKELCPTCTTLVMQAILEPLR